MSSVGWRCGRFLKTSFFFSFLLFSFSIFSQPQESPYSQGRYQEAIERLEKKLPDRKAFLDLLILYKELGRYKKVFSLLERCPLYKNDKEVKVLWAEVCYLNDDLEKARLIFKEVENKYPPDWRVFLYLGLIYEEENRFPLAEKYYLKCLQLRKNAIALYRLSKIFYKKREFKRAEKYFQELIAFDPSIRLSYYYLGICLLKERNYLKAYKFLFRAKSFYPHLKKVKEGLHLAKGNLGKRFFRKEKKKKEERRKRVKLASYKRVKDKQIPLVKVGILQAVKRFKFKCGTDFKISGRRKVIQGKKNRLYTVLVKNNNRVIFEREGKKIGGFIPPVDLKAGDSPFYILDVSLGEKDFWHRIVDTQYRGDLEVIVRDNKITLINVVSIEEYLYGVLPAEIPPFANYEALKAQAVAARTIALKNLGRHRKSGFDFCSEVHCQVYRGKSGETPLTNKAVDDTRGEVITYNGELIEAFYHANCGGCLRDDAFGKREYLFNKLDKKEDTFIDISPLWLENWMKQGEKTLCSFTKKKSNFRWQRVYDREDYQLIFNSPLEEVRSILPLERDECGHIKKIKIEKNNKLEVVEEELNIRRYLDNLRSSSFIVEMKYKKEKKGKLPYLIFIWGAGFGHGSGLCQEGAMRMGEEGFNYKEILTHYYQGVKIEKIYGSQ